MSPNAGFLLYVTDATVINAVIICRALAKLDSICLVLKLQQ